MSPLDVSPHKKFDGVYWIKSESKERSVATLNLAPGKKVYGEELVSVKGAEYRIWDPFHSKFAAAILRGMKEVPIRPNHRVLYLGVATGTTVSHISDIVGRGGLIYGVEFAPRVMRKFIDDVCTFRHNIVPILADARAPETYRMLVGMVDAIYCDIAQPRQASILADNSDFFLKNGGGFLLTVKARSIDVTASPSNMYRGEIAVLRRRGFEIREVIPLSPYSEDHVMVVGVKT